MDKLSMIKKLGPKIICGVTSRNVYVDDEWVKKYSVLFGIYTENFGVEPIDKNMVNISAVNYVKFANNILSYNKMLGEFSKDEQEVLKMIDSALKTASKKEDPEKVKKTFFEDLGRTFNLTNYIAECDAEFKSASRFQLFDEDEQLQELENLAYYLKKLKSTHGHNV